MRKYVFHHYKARERNQFPYLLEKVRVSKGKLDIDVSKLPKKRKVLSHYEEEEAPAEFASTVREHYRQIFISAEILH